VTLEFTLQRASSLKAELQRRRRGEMSTDPAYFAHESSCIDDGVEIGAGTRIWHFCHLMRGTRIGRDCRIGQNVVIGPNVRLGKNVKVQNNVSIYEGVTLEDDVFCGPSVVFTNVLTPRAGFPRNRPEDFRPTLVRRGASLGANATIVCGCTIEEFALVGAGSVITRDVRPYSLVYGNPARHRGWACRCGVPLRFAGGRTVCATCGAEFAESAAGIELLSAGPRSSAESARDAAAA
jgi:UDP-2-acetamido-3-amino-2,3-dideoxy-glucuronate N-acetyltransferase